MRASICWFVLVASLVTTTLIGSWGEASAQVESPALVPQDGMLAVALDGNETADLVALIDTRTRVMSVYRIDRGSGEITLASVRNVSWDLQLDEFNGTKPTPRDVRSLIQSR